MAKSLMPRRRQPRRFGPTARTPEPAQLSRMMLLKRFPSAQSASTTLASDRVPLPKPGTSFPSTLSNAAYFSPPIMNHFILTILTFVALALSHTHAAPLGFEGTQGPGRGKHIVFLAGDHEYRSEETLPALARILAKRYGFKCSVFITTNPQTGFIEPGSSDISGLEALDTADLLVIALRFQDFPDSEMQHIADYLDRGGPVVGLRTATHAFQIKRPDAKFLKFDWKNAAAYPGGFGRQILGETWVSHYGTNHVQSSVLVFQPDEAAHPILRGVKDVWVQSGGYTAAPIEGSRILATGRILNGMTPDSPPAADKQEQPVAWYRSYS